MEEYMDQENKRKIEFIITERKRAQYKLNLNSNIMKEYDKVISSGFYDGQINRLNKELIALGISIITACESCMQWHIAEAIKHGTTEKQLYEVIEVSIAMAGSRMEVNTRFAIAVIEYYKEKGELKN
jgi:AhpD family alkylhydroperoxidase